MGCINNATEAQKRGQTLAERSQEGPHKGGGIWVCLKGGVYNPPEEVPHGTLRAAFT